MKRIKVETFRGKLPELDDFIVDWINSDTLVGKIHSVQQVTEPAPDGHRPEILVMFFYEMA